MRTYILVNFCLAAFSFIVRIIVLAADEYPRASKPKSTGSDAAHILIMVPFLLWAAFLLWA